MFGIGALELAVILGVALLVFGPKRLPELARTLGKGLAEFRRASADLRQGLSLDPDPPGHRPPAAHPKTSVDPREDRDLDSVPSQSVGTPGELDLGPLAAGRKPSQSPNEGLENNASDDSMPADGHRDMADDDEHDDEATDTARESESDRMKDPSS